MKIKEIQYWMLGNPQQRAQETKAKEIYTLNSFAIL